MRPEIIGIIGRGFVGGAVEAAMRPHCELRIFDRDPQKSTHEFGDLLECEAIFVCVSTPTTESGECDTRALEQIIHLLKTSNYRGIIISKSTAPPDVYGQLENQFTRLVHVPEFLTQLNANADYVDGRFCFIGGGDRETQEHALRIIRIGQRKLRNRVHFTDIRTVSLLKYTINSFLATKVSFMNEIWDLCQRSSINYGDIQQMLSRDPRIGATHLQVPGPDGARGYGGACFPKDTRALSYFAGEYNLTLAVLGAAMQYNARVRPADAL